MPSSGSHSIYVTSRRLSATISQTIQWSAPNKVAFLSTNLHTALQVLGFPYQNFAGHSFKIGAATAALRAGIEDSTIQAMGHWSSGAFLNLYQDS